MKIEQTGYFKDDVKHYTAIAADCMYTTRADEIRAALYRLDRMRGTSYTDKVAAKCNQKLKKRFYYRAA